MSIAITFAGGWLAGWAFLALFWDPYPQECPGCGEPLWDERARLAIGDES